MCYDFRSCVLVLVLAQRSSVRNLHLRFRFLVDSFLRLDLRTEFEVDNMKEKALPHPAERFLTNLGLTERQAFYFVGLTYYFIIVLLFVGFVGFAVFYLDYEKHKCAALCDWEYVTSWNDSQYVVECRPVTLHWEEYDESGIMHYYKRPFTCEEQEAHPIGMPPRDNWSYHILEESS